MPKTLRILIWLTVAILGALALGTVALHRGEQINAMWLVVAAVCTYAVGYRFYSKFIAAKVLVLDAQRATPAERSKTAVILFPPTNGWSSAITSPPSPDQGRWWGRCWRPSSDISQARFGFLRARFRRLRAGFCHSAVLGAA